MCESHLKIETVFTSNFDLKTAYCRYKHKQENCKTEDKLSYQLLVICFILPKLNEKKKIKGEIKASMLCQMQRYIRFFSLAEASQCNMTKKT